MKILERFGSGSKEYNVIINVTIAIVLFLVDLYTQMIYAGWDFIEFTWIDNELLRRVIQTIVHFIIYSLAYAAFYLIVYFAYNKFYWKKVHKNIYLEGTWLHIHDKANVKIGVVEIKQQFYNLSVNAVNVQPNINKVTERTTWRYIGNEFKPDGEMGDYLLSCYLAKRTNEESKKGIHVFDKPLKYDAKGFPSRLNGRFYDDCKVANGGNIINIADKTGEIYLFKMTDRISKIISYSANNMYFDQIALSNIMHNLEAGEEEFVKALKRVMHKNTLQKKFRIVQENCVSGLINPVEDIIKKVISYAAFSDGMVEEKELDCFNNITGFKWTSSDVRTLLIGCNSESVLSELKTVLEKVVEQDKATYAACKNLLLYACENIIESDEEIKRAEAQFLAELKKILV